jgi:hypothetical protein
MYDGKKAESKHYCTDNTTEFEEYGTAKCDAYSCHNAS